MLEQQLVKLSALLSAKEEEIEALKLTDGGGIKTVSATFHDYCIDFAEYLKPDVYAHFLQQLFDHLIEIYLSGK